MTNSTTSGSGSSEELTQEMARSYQMRTLWDLDLMRRVAEFDRSELYVEEGYCSAAEWLAARFAMGYHSACKFTEIAISLEQLPRMQQAYRTGVISYDHLRALVQVAGPDNEDDLLEATEGLSVADTWRLVRKIIEVSAEDSRFNREQRWLQMRWDHENRQLFLWAVLPEDQAVTVEKAIDALATKIPDEPAPSDEEQAFTPMGMKRADALAELASSALVDQPARAQVVVHTDLETLRSGQGVAEIDGGPTISRQTLQRLACDSSVQMVVHDEGGKPIGMGRKRRTVDPRTLRELRRRDQGCRWPGCNRLKVVDAHHIIHWGEDNWGPSDYDNLVLLCPTHHTLVHEGEWKIRGAPPKIWVERPDLTPIKMGPPRTEEELADAFNFELGITMGTIRPPDS